MNRRSFLLIGATLGTAATIGTLQGSVLGKATSLTDRQFLNAAAAALLDMGDGVQRLSEAALALVRSKDKAADQAEREELKAANLLISKGARAAITLQASEQYVFAYVVLQRVAFFAMSYGQSLVAAIGLDDDGLMTQALQDAKDFRLAKDAYTAAIKAIDHSSTAVATATRRPIARPNRQGPKLTQTATVVQSVATEIPATNGPPTNASQNDPTKVPQPKMEPTQPPVVPTTRPFPPTSAPSQPTSPAAVIPIEPTPIP